MTDRRRFEETRGIQNFRLVTLMTEFPEVPKRNFLFRKIGFKMRSMKIRNGEMGHRYFLQFRWHTVDVDHLTT